MGERGYGFVLSMLLNTDYNRWQKSTEGLRLVDLDLNLFVKEPSDGTTG